VKLLTLARDLRRRKARERDGLFVVEGLRAVEALERSELAVRGVMVASGAEDNARAAPLVAAFERRGVSVVTVSDREFGSATQTESPQGILAVAEVPGWSLDQLRFGSKARLLVLDALQDPGNVGTILRTGAALGVSATIALPGTVDLWNAKVVRSAMGAHFSHPAFHCTWEQLDPFLGRNSVEVWGADASGDAPDTRARPERLALAVGNEGSGLGADTRRRCANVVGLPAAPGAESLNVAVATGILLYALRV
jgi:TrmH family RNA methyltransferase